MEQITNRLIEETDIFKKKIDGYLQLYHSGTEEQSKNQQCHESCCTTSSSEKQQTHLYFTADAQFDGVK